MKTLLALCVGATLALAQAHAGAQDGGGGRGGPRQDLDVAQSLARWLKLRVEGEPGEALQLGEAVVAAGGTLAQQIWARSVLAADRIDHGQFERARVLIAEAAERTSSFLWRAAPDGGSAGYTKHNTLNQLQRAQCLMATRQFRPDEADTACAASLDSARKARELQRFSGRSQAAVDGDLLHALIDRAQAHRMAGRNTATQQVLRQAQELVAAGTPGRGATASFYRSASQLAMDMGEKRQARDWALRAVDIWPAEGEAGVHTARLKGRAALQRALVFNGEWQAANEEFDSFDDATRGSPVATRARFNLLARALAYAHAGRLHRLQARLRNGASQWQDRLGAEHPGTAMREGLLGAALMADAGANAPRTEGLTLLTRAAETLLEAQRRGDPLPALGIEGLATRFVLEQFLRTRQSNPSPPESRASILAYQVADFLRGSRVQGAIEDAAVRSAATAAGLGDLVRREQDARSEMRSLQDVLAGRTTDGVELATGGAVAAARLRVQELEAAGATLRAQIAKAFPKYDALVRPKLPGTAEVIRQLALGEAFVLMLPVEDGVHLWALTWTDQSYRFAALPPQQLAQSVEALRRSTELVDGPVKPFAHDAAWQLYRDLLAPLDKQLAGARHLIVAGGGVLGSVPFAALLTAPPQGQAGSDMPWLARRMAVSQVPGASAWLAIQRLGAGARPDQPLLAWGDPSFTLAQAPPALTATSAGTRQVLGTATRGDAGAAAPRYADLPALPETRDELLAIAATLKADPGRDLLLGERATRASVLAANAAGQLVTRRVLAFATHGLMAGDLPNLDQPALAMAATTDAERDPLAPLLKLDDVLGLKLNADWVVLSACNTAAADGRAEEALSGLARGFFYAGARSLLVTHWAVETESAKLLTTRTFEHYATNPYAGKAESLRQAMLQVMAMPRYQHPAFWAPYALVGDGAR